MILFKYSLPLAAIAFAATTAGATVYPTTPAPISLTSVPYTQNFNTLASTGATGTALPTGWQVSENGSNANTTYGVDDGGNNAGNVYSYGADGSSERALGSLGSGSNGPLYYGAFFQNALGATINSLSIGYTGEQWRGGTTADQLVFQYSLNATSIDSVAATWINIASLAFTPPNASTAGALDGNATANRTALTGTLSGLTVLNGSTFAIRWMDIDNSGSDDGLAIDDVRVAASTIAAVPEPATWAMLVLGFGLVGATTRHRRRSVRRVFA